MTKLEKYNRQPNRITLSRQKFSVTEKRIVYLIINQLETDFNVDQDLFRNREFSVPIKELGETNYRRLRDECRRLRNKEIGIPNHDNKYTFWDVNPFPEARLNKDGTLFIKMLDTAVPYFIELKKGFTTYQLKAALTLTSVYSQRIYELLSKYKDTGIWQKVEIDYLKRLMAIEDKYPKIGMFRERVLNPAQNELKEKTEINFEYTLYKTGRKYTHITFNIHCKENKQSEQPKNLTEKQTRCLKYLEQLGITNKKLQNTILQDKHTEFWKWLHFYRQNKNNIQNPAGHLLKSLNVQ